MGEALKGFFGSWFSTDGFNVWKLNTVWDFVFFGIIIALGIVACRLAIRFLDSGRTPEKAAARVEKRLRTLGGPGAKVYRNVTLQTKKDTARIDMLWAAKDRIYIVKVYHFGIEISGAADSRTWRMGFNKDFREVPNPLPALREQAVVVNRLFQRQGVTNAPVSPLVIFADNYGTAKPNLKDVDCAVAYQMLRKWRKQVRPLPKSAPFDLEAAQKAIETCVET